MDAAYSVLSIAQPRAVLALRPDLPEGHAYLDCFQSLQSEKLYCNRAPITRHYQHRRSFNRSVANAALATCAG